MAIGPETYTGTITDGPASTALNSVNVVNDVTAGGITRVTPPWRRPTRRPGVPGHRHRDGANLVVDALQPNTTGVPANTTGLLGAGLVGSGWRTPCTSATRIAISERISPDDQPSQLLSGATMLVRDGAVYTDPTGTPRPA